MEVIDQHHTLAALFPGNNPSMHCIGGWVDPTASLDILVKQKLPSPASIQITDHPTFSLVSILITLSRLHLRNTTQHNFEYPLTSTNFAKILKL
jgi:hypothetical protein